MDLESKCIHDGIVTTLSNSFTLRSNRALPFLGLSNPSLLVRFSLKPRFVQREILLCVSQFMPGGLEETLRLMRACHSRVCRQIFGRVMRSSGQISVSQTFMTRSDLTYFAFPGMTVLLAVLSPNSSASISRIVRWLELRYLGIVTLNSTHRSPKAFFRATSFGIP